MTNAQEKLDEAYTRLNQFILTTFQEIQRFIASRKEALLIQLEEIKEKNKQNIDLNNAIYQLEFTKESMLSSMSSNLLSTQKEQHRISITRDINELKSKRIEVLNLELLDLRCHMTKLQQEIANIQLTEVLPQYVNRTAPVIRTCKRGVGMCEVKAPRAITVDINRNELYIADSGNSRIEVLNLDGNYCREIGNADLEEPSGVFYANNHVYVTDVNLDAVFKLRRDGTCVERLKNPGSREGQLDSPTSLYVMNSRVYVCDTNNNRIQVLNTNLNPLSSFGEGHLILPTDIKIRSGQIYVLTRDDNKMHGFTMEGQHLWSLPLTGQERQISVAFFFELDSNGNLIIPDPSGQCLKVFSNDYRLKQVLGRDTLYRPIGIVLAGDEQIITSCDSETNCIQVY
ncbi:RING finger protein nhl-1 [Oopsacas minuta]|uniref:RING finger protein nhl-1 n=1 Tax=Oopsacas minuta TaxID=111878 RepID=A0AAV7KH40_9METZ|nr:RING finger protein nhl-1 [Oopsacas minuta]